MIASAASRASSGVPGILRSDTKSVGGRPAAWRRRATMRHSWIPVFSEWLILWGSCDVTMRSIWNRLARYYRSGSPEALTQALTGTTLAKHPRSLSKSRSASGVKNRRAKREACAVACRFLTV